MTWPPRLPPCRGTSLQMLPAAGRVQASQRAILSCGQGQPPGNRERLYRKKRGHSLWVPGQACAAPLQTLCVLRKLCPSPQRGRKGLFPLKQKGMWSQPRLWESRGSEQEVTGNAMTRKKQGWLSPTLLLEIHSVSCLPGQGNINSAGGFPFHPFGVLESVLGFWNLYWGKFQG